MGILDELKPKTTQLDELDAWIASRPKDEQAEWKIALSDDVRYSCGAIARLLTSKGCRANDNLVLRYRRREANRVA